MLPKPSANESFWRAFARKTAIRASAAWVLSVFLPALVAISAALACVIAYERSSGRSEGWEIWGAYFALVVVSLLASSLVARRKFVSPIDALSRLDAACRLDGRLSSAASGIGEWPDPMTEARDGLTWRWTYLASPALISIVLVVSASLVPVGVPIDVRVAVTEPPLSVTQVESWMEKLAEESVVEKRALEDLKDRLESLRPEESGDWYSHRSLEAADNFEQSVSRDLEELRMELETAIRRLESLEKAESEAAFDEMTALRSELAESAEQLGSGPLPLDSPAIRELNRMPPGAEIPKALKERLMKELKERRQSMMSMKERHEGGSCSGTGGGAPMCAQPGTGLASGDGDGDMAAFGSPSRGPGTAPLNLEEKAPSITSNIVEVLPPRDGAAEPEIGQRIGRSARAPSAALDSDGLATGGFAEAGSGGEAVWKDTLIPTERKVLEEYFR